MIEKTIYATLDGINHVTVDAARRHADKIYSKRLSSLAVKIVSLDFKYLAVMEFLDAAVADGTLSALKPLRDDMVLNQPEV